ncbi:hypothetical protein NLX83_16310 [Allokutzneria sp. A3M-2-11 16]|uniref:hypothetical protein n=1 Tax=Allokutzneria sp. A3M-2-11 16 TaxID=2962043 RepID=UPI0020B8FD06|nr:hypothetical protein [Allokutzneria sp. A3M-2-11 16]MCP3800829.1 hypothetical protein [Allokutzneria sp. A3M-2-11 16]
MLTFAILLPLEVGISEDVEGRYLPVRRVHRVSVDSVAEKEFISDLSATGRTFSRLSTDTTNRTHYSGTMWADWLFVTTSLLTRPR